MDLYSFPTPNGHKVSICLEELGVPYNVKKVDIRTGEQFDPNFLKINPNNKIPALVDGDTVVFESVAILMYLAEKYGKFIPSNPKDRLATIQWCFFQAANVGPMFGQFGHFTVYAKKQIPYAIERYKNEVNRLFGVMDGQLAKRKYLACDEYTIADIATWPWINSYQNAYKQKLDAEKFPNVARWFNEICTRPAVQKGIKVPQL